MSNYLIVEWFESITKKDELIKRQFPKTYVFSLLLVLSIIVFLGHSPLFITMAGIYVLSIWNYLAQRVNKSKHKNFFSSCVLCIFSYCHAALYEDPRTGSVSSCKDSTKYNTTKMYTQLITRNMCN